MIYILDSDMNGTDSYQFLVDAGLVKHIPCPTFEVFDKAVGLLLGFANPQSDVVFLDGASSLTSTARADTKFGTGSEAVWDKRHLYLDGDKNYLTMYEMAGQMTIRRLRNLRAYGFRIIVSALEADQVDLQIKKRAPDLNKAFYASLKAASSDMFRLWTLPQDVMSADGTTLRFKAGTRVVGVKGDDTRAAKIHVDPFAAEQVPPNIPIESVFIPTLPKVYSFLWKLPSFLLIYGEPGVGKTSAGLSEAFAQYLEAHYPDKWASALATFNQEQRQTGVAIEQHNVLTEV